MSDFEVHPIGTGARLGNGGPPAAKLEWRTLAALLFLALVAGLAIGSLLS